MSGRYIDENVKRRLYAESMGYCMNPNCRCNLFAGTGDIIEKAHIDPYARRQIILLKIWSCCVQIVIQILIKTMLLRHKRF